MKLINKFYFILLLAINSFIVSGQYNVIFNFDDPLGMHPCGTLLYDDGYLYGTTFDGGMSTSCLYGGCGVLFRINPDGTYYTKIFEFNETNGEFPNGSLISDGTYLYGMTYKGGTHGTGTLFKIKPDGFGFTKLMDFTGSNGSYPKGSLFYDGIFLYGMTVLGGETDHGTIFKLNTDGSGYTKLHDFDVSSGNGPYADLISDGTFLYGMTWGGGDYDHGVIFRIKPDGTAFTKLNDFDETVNGINPWGNLISDGKYLYGMTHSGGSNYRGVIFKIKIDGSDYIKLHDFEGPDGSSPVGSLLLNGSYLYGLTHWGGIDDTYGVLFRVDTLGNDYSVLHTFDNIHGADPKGALVLFPPFFYGLTYQGGTNFRGTLFKYLLTQEKNKDIQEIKVYPNPLKNLLTINGTMAGGEAVLYSINGEEIVRSRTSDFTTKLSIPDISKGIYYLNYNDNKNQYVNIILVKL